MTNEEKTIEKTQEIVSNRLKWMDNFIERNLNNLNISKDDMNLIRLEIYDAILEIAAETYDTILEMAEWKDKEYEGHINELLSAMKHDSERIKELIRENNLLQMEKETTNEKLAKTISETSYEYGDYLLGISKDNKEQRYIGAIQMAELKDKNNKERELLLLLLEVINYSFLQTDGNYDNKLTYPVIDKVKYIYSQLHLIDNNSDVNNKIGYLKK